MKKLLRSVPFFIVHDDFVDADNGIIFDIETLPAIIANFIRVEVAHFALQTTYTISVIKNTFL